MGGGGGVVGGGRILNCVVEGARNMGVALQPTRSAWNT